MKYLARADAERTFGADDCIMVHLISRGGRGINVSSGAREADREKSDSENGFDGGREGTSVFHVLFDFVAKRADVLPNSQSCFSP